MIETGVSFFAIFCIFLFSDEVVPNLGRHGTVYELGRGREGRLRRQGSAERARRATVEKMVSRGAVVRRSL